MKDFEYKGFRVEYKDYKFRTSVPELDINDIKFKWETIESLEVEKFSSLRALFNIIILSGRKLHPDFCDSGVHVVKDLVIREGDGSDPKNIFIKSGSEGVLWSWKTGEKCPVIISINSVTFTPFLLEIEGSEMKNLTLDFEYGFLHHEYVKVFFDTCLIFRAAGKKFKMKNGVLGSVEEGCRNCGSDCDGCTVLEQCCKRNSELIMEKACFTVFSYDIEEIYDNFPYHHPDSKKIDGYFPTLPPGKPFCIKNEDVQRAREFFRSRGLVIGNVDHQTEIFEPTEEQIEDGKKLIMRKIDLYLEL